MLTTCSDLYLQVFLNLTKESQKNNNMSLEHLTQRKIGNPSTNGMVTPDDLSVSSSNFTDRDGIYKLFDLIIIYNININMKICLKNVKLHPALEALESSITQ